MIRVSPLSLRTFRECPRRFRYQYIDRLGKYYGRPRPYFTMGNNVHAALKDFLSVVPPQQRSLETLEHLLMQKWAKDHSGFEDPEQERDYLKRARRQLRWFVESQDMSVSPFMTERFHEAPLAQGIILRGRIDRVDREPDGTLHIIDYKTGQLPSEMDDEPLLLYAVILTRALHANVNRASYVFLGEGASHDLSLTSDILDETKENTLETAHAIESEQNYPGHPSSRCLYCDYAVICEEKQER
jgi:RecB family exonuclease